MKNRTIRNAFLFAALTLSTIGAQAAGVLTDKKGMTLYTYGRDKGAVSSCYEACAKLWPPYVGKKGDKMKKGWALAKRTDGKMQWTYDGKPLYFFARDKKKGDMNGEGMGGVWHTVAG